MRITAIYEIKRVVLLDLAFVRLFSRDSQCFLNAICPLQNIEFHMGITHFSEVAESRSGRRAFCNWNKWFPSGSRRKVYHWQVNYKHCSQTKVSIEYKKSFCCILDLSLGRIYITVEILSVSYSNWIVDYKIIRLT